MPNTSPVFSHSIRPHRRWKNQKDAELIIKADFDLLSFRKNASACVSVPALRCVCDFAFCFFLVRRNERVPARTAVECLNMNAYIDLLG